MSFGTNTPFGLTPVKTFNGYTWNQGFNYWQIASGAATAPAGLFTGDPVAPQADGTLGIGLAGATCCGVFAGCTYTNPQGQFIDAPYFPAGQVTLNALPGYAAVIADPTAIFEIQTNGNPGLLQTAVNNNANFVAGAGNTAIGSSGYALDQTTLGNAATLNLRIVALSADVRNAPALAYNTAYVTINNHSYKGGVLGV